MLQLTWLGDEQAKRAARHVPYRLLETISQHGAADAPNWLTQGKCVFTMVTHESLAGLSANKQLHKAIRP